VLTRNQDDVLTFAFDGKSGTVLDYHHFSVVMSKGRRMCRFSACNIDGDQSKRTGRAGWQFDPRIPNSAQIMKECYGAEPKFSRGHMTRREDPAWGSAADLGNRDSMHVTNTVPQIQPFNGGIWMDLEDYALQNARKDKMQISVFTGPFLDDSDPIRFGVKVPVIFWKVIAFIHDQTGKLCATGYTMSQKSFIGEEEFVFGRHENNQRPIKEIERRAGISFGPLAELDPLKDQLESVAAPLTRASQIRFLP
jgi:endonuclease G